jgi:hypothetical protein
MGLRATVVARGDGQRPRERAWRTCCARASCATACWPTTPTTW